ncbi:kelch 12-like protein [Elysia marginata]|uniref:Kelch 12-like protein n=1 Tax=Elysia marginata TaxID=1093978 RepID=A0AAV4JBM2_9GAST|nr:kelch 12-like protein [Elysia marginata]
MLESESKTTDSSPKLSACNHIRYVKQSNTLFKRHNPFGGRRMVLETCSPDRGRRQNKNHKDIMETNSFYKSVGGNKNNQRLDGEEKASSPAQRNFLLEDSKGANAANFLHDDNIRTLESSGSKTKYSDMDIESTAMHDHIRLSSCQLHTNVELVAQEKEIEIISEKNLTKDTPYVIDKQSVENDDRKMTPKYVGSNLKSKNTQDRTYEKLQTLLQSRDPKPRSEKYTIVFTKERTSQENLPVDSSIAASQDEMASGDCRPDQEPHRHWSNSCRKNTIKSKQRKFVIRREKHVAESGREEDATYTIHVYPQSLSESSGEVVSNSQPKKKETRGDIFRKNALCSEGKHNYFRSGNTRKPTAANKEVVSQRESAADGHEQVRVKRVSSLSPPRQKRNDFVSTQRRAKSQNAGKTSTEKGSRRRPIRLIDHLERKERSQTGGNHTSFDPYTDGNHARSENVDLPFGKAEHISTKEPSKSVYIPEHSVLRHGDFELTGIVTKNDKSHSKAQLEPCKAGPTLYTSNRTKCVRPINLDTITDVSKCKGSNIVEQKQLTTRKSVESETEIRDREQDHPYTISVSKKDVACQYSPPTAIDFCCLCHCHKIEGALQKSSTSISNKVTTKGQKYHKIRNFYPPKSSPTMNGKTRQERSRACKIKISLERKDELDEIECENGVYIEEEDKYKEKKDEEIEVEGGEILNMPVENKSLEENEATEHSENGSRVYRKLSQKYEEEDNYTDANNCDERGNFMLTSDSSSTPTENVSKNNSAARKKKAAQRNKNVSNSFRDIVERAKRKSSVKVRALDKNCSFQRERDTPVLGQTGHTEDAGHYFIGDYLCSLWKKQVLCDVRVNVNNTHFLAHKLVLAAFSDIFTPTTPYPEPTLQFTVPNAYPESVYRVFKYIYTANMDVRDDQLEETLNVGTFLGINEIKDVILEILSRPTLDNVELYIEVQNRCGIPASVMDYPHLYQNYLIQMIYMEKFLQLTPEELEVILRDPNVLVETEVDTLHALAVWAQYNPLERVPEVARLLDFIIFEVISPENIAKIVQMYDPIFAEMGSRNKISEVFRFHALLLSNQVAVGRPTCPGTCPGNKESFVQDVPGITQDPLLDRVSYIPSQGTLAKHQERPTLTRPSLRKSTAPTETGRNSIRSAIMRPGSRASIGRNSVIGAAKSFMTNFGEPMKSFATTFGEPSKSLAPLDTLNRRSIRSRGPSCNSARGCNANTSNRKSRGRRKQTMANRSNNSAVKSVQEMQPAIIQDNHKKGEEVYTNLADIEYRSCEFNNADNKNQDSKSIDLTSNQTSARKSCRLTRQDHWDRACCSLGSGVEFQESPIPRDRSSGPPTLIRKFHPEIKVNQDQSVLSKKSGCHPSLWLSGSQQSGTSSRLCSFWEGEVKLADRLEKSQMSYLKNPTTGYPLCSCCFSNTPEQYVATRVCLRKSLAEKCDASEYKGGVKEHDGWEANKNSNASSLFQLV